MKVIQCLTLLGNVLCVLFGRMDDKLLIKLLARPAYMQIKYTTTRLSAWLYKMNQCSKR